jgi:hypothetical protein
MLNNIVMTSPVRNETMSWVLKIGGFIMSIAIMISSWFLNQAMQRINNVENSIKVLELSNATIAGSKFTATDWANAKSVLDADRNAIDRRIVRLEENSAVIKDALIEIKQILKEQR